MLKPLIVFLIITNIIPIYGVIQYWITFVVDCNPADYWKMAHKIKTNFPDIRGPNNDADTDWIISSRIANASQFMRTDEKSDDLLTMNGLRIINSSLCHGLLKDNGSIAIVIVHHNSYHGQTSVVSSLAYSLGFYTIPLIDLGSRDIQFSNKEMFPTFLRLVPSWIEQIHVLIQLLKRMEFSRVILVYTPSDVGKKMANSFETIASKYSIVVDGSLELENDTVPDQDFEQAKDATTSNIMILLYASPHAVKEVLSVASRHGYFTKGRLWLFSEYVMIHTQIKLPPGIIGPRLSEKYARLETNLQLAHKAVSHSFARLWKWNLNFKINGERNKNSVQPPSDCSPSKAMHFGTKSFTPPEFWMNFAGEKFYKYLTEYTFKEGANGDKIYLAFGKNGDRISNGYDIINSQYTNEKIENVIVGSCRPQPLSPELDTLRLGMENITWLGGYKGAKYKPKSHAFKGTVSVITVPDTPFVYHKLLSDLVVDSCEQRTEQVPYGGYSIKGPWVPCSFRNKREPYCCSGLCIDLIIDMFKSKTFEIHADGVLEYNVELEPFYGIHDPLTDRWNGAVSRLLEEENPSDLVVAALSINPERERNIDFSAPWLYHGISILEKMKPRLSPMQSFMQPFHISLWSSLLVAVFVMGMALHIIDKYSPFNLYQKKEEEVFGEPLKPKKELITDPTWENQVDEDEPLNLSGSMWFVWGVLLDSGIGERVPRSLSARILGIIWCGFCMIMVASYTANLAAFLVLDRPTTALTGLEDPRLKNPNSGFNYSTVKNSNTFSFFQRHVEHSTIFRTMEKHNVENAAEAIEQLKTGKLGAFIWDSKKLEFEASKDCDLELSGNEFGKSSYAIGMRKGSIWSNVVTLTVLELVENGRMEDLESKWITDGMSCESKTETTHPVRLGLTNMRDLFILVCGGFVFGSFLIMIERVYKKRQIHRLYQRKIALYYGRIWRNKCRETGKLRTYDSSPQTIVVSKYSDNGNMSNDLGIIGDQAIKCINQNNINEDKDVVEAERTDREELDVQVDDEFGFKDFREGVHMTKALYTPKSKRKVVQV